jgi:hypothetical protein
MHDCSLSLPTSALRWSCLAWRLLFPTAPNDSKEDLMTSNWLKANAAWSMFVKSLLSVNFCKTTSQIWIPSYDGSWRRACPWISIPMTSWALSLARRPDFCSAIIPPTTLFDRLHYTPAWHFMKRWSHWHDVAFAVFIQITNCCLHVQFSV